jgi:hypothetical protein
MAENPGAPEREPVGGGRAASAPKCNDFNG